MVDSDSAVTEIPALVVTIIVGATVLVIVYISSLFKSQREENVKKPVSESMPVKEASDHIAGGKPKKKQHADKWPQKFVSKQSYTHQWMITSLKGHTGQVQDMEFSSNGKFLATVAEDRALFIWSTKDFTNKEHKSLRYNIDYDHASLVCWSPDTKAFMINRATENVLEVCKVIRKADGWISGIAKAVTFPKLFEEETVGIGIALTGKFIMSCSAANQLYIWDLKGSVLATVDTYLMNTYRARISPCGRFVAASGFAPDVKVWEVIFSKSGEFKQIARAFELQGHTSGVYDLGFSADSSRMATISKDGTWKFFNTKIEFEKGEDPHLLLSGNYKPFGNSAHLALSPNGEVVAIATGSNLHLFSTHTGICDKTISNVYSGSITRVLFDSAGDYILTSGEKHIRVFHNVTGRRTAIVTAKKKLNASNNSAATKERLENIIKQAEDFLISLGESARAEG